MKTPRFASMLVAVAISLAIRAPLAAQDATTNATSPPDEPASTAAERQDAIVVVVSSDARVSEPLRDALTEALVEHLRAMSNGRPIRGITDPTVREALARCGGDEVCIGQQVVRAGAKAGIIAKLSPRGARRAEMSLELRDASGVSRAPALTGELPLDPEAFADATAPLVERLRSALPAPPPTPTLLVTVNVDGARVLIDGEEIGTSPVAPVEVREGRREVAVTMPGYLDVRRQEQIAPGERARIDVRLQPIGAHAAALTTGAVTTGEGRDRQQDLTSEWWFWTAVGAAALVLGVAIGVGVAVSDHNGLQPHSDPRGIMLPPLTGGL